MVKLEMMRGLMEMSEAHKASDSSSTLDMQNIMMSKSCAPNYNLYMMKQQEELLREAPALLPATRVNRIPVSPHGASYSNMMSSASAASSRQMSKSVPSSPTFDASASASSLLHRHHLLASGRSSCGRAQFHEYNNGVAASSTADSTSGLLTASLDLATASSCASNLAADALRSANFSRGNHHHSNIWMNSSDDAAALKASDQYSINGVTASNYYLPNYAATYNSCGLTHNNNMEVGAKKRRLQQLKSFPASTYTGVVDVLTSAATALLDQGQVDAAPIEAEMSTNNSPLNFEGDHDQSTMKGDIDMNGNLQAASIVATMLSASAAVSGKPSTTETGTSSEPQLPAPKQDYIHVRARRGQATDSHSLAERVRREKISERMKFLQDLVPGCNKITGKAVMLDEIINYVQSLQRQVEFLSMKLSTVSPPTNRYDATTLASKAEPQTMDPINQTSMVATLHHIHDQHTHHLQHNHLPLDMKQHVQQESPIIGAAQVWEDELQTLVQMGYPTLS